MNGPSTIRAALRAALASILLAGTAHAQATEGGDPARVDIGGGFSVAVPAGPGWRTSGTPGWSYVKRLAPDGHSLTLVALTGPSGISREDLLGLRGPDAGSRLVKLVTRFVERAWESHAAGLRDERFEKIEAAHDTGGKFSIGTLICASSRIRVRDRGAMVDGVPSQLRYVAYRCVELPDMSVAADVSYSERGRDQDLADEAMAEGERFARSLRRRP